MAYRCGDRYQMRLMPQSIEDYVGSGNPVRAYDAFVEAINFRELGITIERRVKRRGQVYSWLMLG
jgi:hypothetical protein